MATSASPVVVRANSRALLSIIVPVYNEVATVAMVVERLSSSICRSTARLSSSTTDRRTARASCWRHSTRSRHGVRVFRYERNQGKGAAVRLGMSRANGTILAIQDADLELDPQQLNGLVAPILDG